MKDPRSGSMHSVYTALQELQAITLILHRMAFCLSGKVVLQLDNSTAKASLCNQGGTVQFSLSSLACLHIEPGQQAWYHS